MGEGSQGEGELAIPLLSIPREGKGSVHFVALFYRSMLSVRFVAVFIVGRPFCRCKREDALDFEPFVLIAIHSLGGRGDGPR